MCKTVSSEVIRPRRCFEARARLISNPLSNWIFFCSPEFNAFTLQCENLISKPLRYEEHVLLTSCIPSLENGNFYSNTAVLVNK